MKYRRLGRSGLKVSVISLGSWVTFGPQVNSDLAVECMSVARDAGVNFFDNAESYSHGESERIMGQALEELGWARNSYVLSTKLFWGLSEDVNLHNTLNRKYLLQAIDGSLERFGLDFVDVLFCHRADPKTPIQETVETMHDIITSGRALYWGTSEWSAEEIRSAHEIADRHHLRAPITEQPEYNLINRRRVEDEYSSLYEEFGTGLTTWSPLASGLLTGKYLEGIPKGSRGDLEGYEWLKATLTDESRKESVRSFLEIATELSCTPAQLAIAWCAKNPQVSTVITGASRVEQVRENVESLEVLDRLDDETAGRIEELFNA